MGFVGLFGLIALLAQTPAPEFSGTFAEPSGGGILFVAVDRAAPAPALEFETVRPGDTVPPCSADMKLDIRTLRLVDVPETPIELAGASQDTPGGAPPHPCVMPAGR